METDHEARVLGVIREFEKRRRRQLLVLIPVVVAIVAGIAARETDVLEQLGISMDTFGPAFFGVIMVMLGYSFYNWRCPQCRKYLGRDISPRYCTKCGAQLRL